MLTSEFMVVLAWNGVEVLGGEVDRPHFLVEADHAVPGCAVVEALEVADEEKEKDEDVEVLVLSGVILALLHHQVVLTVVHDVAAEKEQNVEHVYEFVLEIYGFLQGLLQLDELGPGDHAGLAGVGDVLEHLAELMSGNQILDEVEDVVEQ